MKKQSIWMYEHKLNLNKELPNDFYTDILIIGGGLTGISTAFHLKDSNYKISIIDSNKIGSGITSKTTGKITYLQDNIYTKLTKIYGKDIAKKYLESQLDACNLIEKIIKNNKINCDYQKNYSIVFTNDKKQINKIKKEEKILRNFGMKIDLINNIENYKFEQGIKAYDQAVFHPLKYLYSLAKICLNNRVDIYEFVKAENIVSKGNYYEVKTNQGIIKTKYVIVACHYPFFNIPYLFPFKTHLERSYVLSANQKNYNYNAISLSKPITSIRYHKNNIIYGALSHKLGTTYDYNDQYDKLITNFKDHFEGKINYIWDNYDIITNDSLPLIGLIKNNFILATGYNKWGMTNASLAGIIIRDIINNKENKYIELFNPKRDINLKKILSFIVDSYDTTKTMIKTTLVKNQPFYKGKISVIKKNGITYGIYIDNTGKVHKVYNKCPHMKCNLIFNEKELTWDCPCHSSRFDIDGNIIKGPSIYSIKIKK